MAGSIARWATAATAFFVVGLGLHAHARQEGRTAAPQRAAAPPPPVCGRLRIFGQTRQMGWVCEARGGECNSDASMCKSVLERARALCGAKPEEPVQEKTWLECVLQEGDKLAKDYVAMNPTKQLHWWAPPASSSDLSALSTSVVQILGGAGSTAVGAAAAVVSMLVAGAALVLRRRYSARDVVMPDAAVELRGRGSAEAPPVATACATTSSAVATAPAPAASELRGPVMV